MAKAHRAVASARNLMVKPNLFPIELGRSLNKAEDWRQEEFSSYRKRGVPWL